MKRFLGLLATTLALIVAAPITLVIALGSDGSAGQLMSQCEAQLGRQVQVLIGAEAGTSDEDIARTIIETGTDLSIPDNGILAALAAALAESGLRNLANQQVPGSLDLEHDAVIRDDAGRLGIYRMQHPRAGSVETLMHPAKASVAFFNTLARIDSWQDLPPEQLAREVLGTPSLLAYQQHLDEATALYRARAVPGQRPEQAPELDLPDDQEPLAIEDPANGHAVNPFADLAVPEESPQIIKDCAQAMRAARVQLFAATAATPTERAYAAALVAASTVGLAAEEGTGSLRGPAEGRIGPVELARYAIHHGSGGALVLPADPAGMNQHGQVVDPGSATAGDLVFTDFTEEGPQRVHVALSSTQIVEAYASDHVIAVAPMPSGNVVIKRNL